MATTSAVTVHVVKVSDMNNTLVFTPNSLVAAPGSLVQFQFYPMNHSVVQAAFSNPCTPIKNVMPSVQGIFSGFMPTNGILTPIFTILINDTQPIWYYCSQGMHCQMGMVGVINPPANETITEFAALAKTETTNITPLTITNTTIHPTTGMPMPTSNASMTTPPLALQTKNAASAFTPRVLSAAAAALVMAVGAAAMW